jgi:hypothetical protein
MVQHLEFSAYNFGGNFQISTERAQKGARNERRRIGNTFRIHLKVFSHTFAYYATKSVL